MPLIHSTWLYIDRSTPSSRFPRVPDRRWLLRMLRRIPCMDTDKSMHILSEVYLMLGCRILLRSIYFLLSFKASLRHKLDLDKIEHIQLFAFHGHYIATNAR